VKRYADESRAVDPLTHRPTESIRHVAGNQCEVMVACVTPHRTLRLAPVAAIRVKML